MPINMPAAPGFIDSDFSLETNTQIFDNPLARNPQRLALAGARWTLSATLPKMNRRQAALWKSFFLRLEGGANTFNAFDPDAPYPLGSGLGTPLIQGAGQTGTTILTDGWTPHAIPLLRGDYFSVNGELKMVTYGQTIDSDVIADVSGQAYINFQPPLRNSPADNAPLTITKPTCTMILVDDMQGKWPCDKNGIYEEKSFSAYEVW